MQSSVGHSSCQPFLPSLVSSIKHLRLVSSPARGAVKHDRALDQVILDVLSSSSLQSDRFGNAATAHTSLCGGLCRFAGESFMTAASMTQLSTKLLSLLQDCICTHLFPELQRRLDKLKGAITPAAKMLLKKGRRCVQQRVAGGGMMAQQQGCPRWKIRGRFTQPNWQHVGCFVGCPSGPQHTTAQRPENRSFRADFFCCCTQAE